MWRNRAAGRDSNPRPLEPHSIGSSEKESRNTVRCLLIYFHSCTLVPILLVTTSHWTLNAKKALNSTLEGCKTQQAMACGYFRQGLNDRQASALFLYDEGRRRDLRGDAAYSTCELWHPRGHDDRQWGTSLLRVPFTQGLLCVICTGLKPSASESPPGQHRGEVSFARTL